MNFNARFEKSPGCPTNESLLALLQKMAPPPAPGRETQEIVEHLATCEFCELTLELLRAYPVHPALDTPSIPPVPESLFHCFTAKRENN